MALSHRVVSAASVRQRSIISATLLRQRSTVQAQVSISPPSLLSLPLLSSIELDLLSPVSRSVGLVPEGEAGDKMV